MFRSSSFHHAFHLTSLSFSGCCFAEIGNHVVCADLDKKKIDGLNNGVLPIYEPGLDEMVKRNAAQKRLTFSAHPTACVRGVDVVFVAVGTPSRSDGGAHLGYVDDVAKMVAENITSNVVLVMKSTVPVGTNKRVRNIVKDSAHKVHVVSNPEFLKEGDAGEHLTLAVALVCMYSAKTIRLACCAGVLGSAFPVRYFDRTCCSRVLPFFLFTCSE